MRRSRLSAPLLSLRDRTAVVALLVGLVAASASGEVWSWALQGGSAPVVATWADAAAGSAATVTAALLLRSALLRAGRPTAAQAVPPAAVAVPIVVHLVALSALAQTGAAGAGDLLWVAARPGWVALAALLLLGGPRVDPLLRASAVLASAGAVTLLIAVAGSLDPSGADHLGDPAPALAAGAALTAGVVASTAFPAWRRLRRTFGFTPGVDDRATTVDG